MPVLSVQRASELLFDGSLVGRFVAIAGYWSEKSIPCPAVPHEPVLDQFCYFVKFADSDLADTPISSNDQSIGLLEPRFVPDSAGSVSMWNDAPPPSGEHGSPLVVVVVHAGDARLWQCEPDRRATCGQALVVDRLAWIDGKTPPPVDGFTDLTPLKSVDEVTDLATTSPDDVAVSAYAVTGDGIIGIDPRLAGIGEGVMWVVRVAVEGSPSEETSAGVVRLISDRTSGQLAEIPLAVASDYAPARLFVDADDQRRPTGTEFGIPQASIRTESGQLVARGYASIFSSPVVLSAGPYALEAWLEKDDGEIVGGPCQTDLDLVPLEEAYLIETFSRTARCSWDATATSPPWY